MKNSVQEDLFLIKLSIDDRKRPGEDREKTGRRPGERECMEKFKKSLAYLVFLNFLNGLGIYLFLTVMQILIYKTTNSVRNISIFIALFTIPKVCFSAILGNIMAKYSMKCMMLWGLRAYVFYA
ncbi:hypothetical protein MWG03_06810 [Fusobacterium necrophorum]|uniref:hypothetical protein n=1 Tax=Fusobacterium necrophorum TaxID=859 RepID=UPI00254A603C|nr:hypothetical protein [Fusobacterium necrophorum]MDK4502041.1 hypothetical protein [Fusobacterium necrophorum]